MGYLDPDDAAMPQRLAHVQVSEPCRFDGLDLRFLASSANRRLGTLQFRSPI